MSYCRMWLADSLTGSKTFDPNEVAGRWESWLSRKDQVGNKTGQSKPELRSEISFRYSVAAVIVERHQHPCLCSKPNHPPTPPPFPLPPSPPALLKPHHFSPGDPFLFSTHSWIIAVSCRLLPAALPNLRLRVAEAARLKPVLRFVKSKSRRPS